MFVGHYAPALLLRERFPEVPLWSLFLGVQAVDVLFFLLAPMGVERVALQPGVGGPQALVLEWMPWSHSLLMTGVWAVVLGGALALGGRRRAGLALGLAVASHWFCDLLVHTPDLHLGLGAEPRVGLGLWSWPVLAYGVEVLLLVACAAWLARAGRGLGRLAALTGVLVVAQTVFAFGPPAEVPVVVLALVSEVSFFGFAGLAAWSERSPAG
ncbi:MAG: hypothetical protein ACI8PZ_006997 [Myxococcota bacterium]|jgi:hypothetical protein